MRIPNKFNGYSADNRRIYNDPTLVVATIANMGEGAAAAAAIAEATAAATAAQTAATAAAEETARQAAVQQAGQAGIMQGASVPPPGATPPGAPGLGAPMPPATPPAPAGVTPNGMPSVEPTGETFPPMEGSPFNQPLPDTPTNAFMPGADAPYTGPQFGQPPGPSTGLENAVNKGPFGDPSGQINQYANAANSSPVTSTPSPKNAFLDGARQAWDVVSKTADDAYEGFKKAPTAVQYATTALAAKPFLFPEAKQQGPAKYKRTPYSGLSQDFTPGGPSPYLYGANGGLMQSYADGGMTGPVEQMSNMNAIGGNAMYPMANIPRLNYANPVQQRPVSTNVIDTGDSDRLDPYTGMPSFADGGPTRQDYQKMSMGKSGSELEADIAQGQAIANKARGSSAGIISRSREAQTGSPNVVADLTSTFKKFGIKSALPKALNPQAGGVGAVEEAANGGIMHGLGGYSDGGRLLKGPGDGVSDSIPATIGSRQPARLADGEFVIPARIVSELGNGSTEAGARQLYAMMERVQKGRKKSVGKGKVAVDSKSAKHLPA
jgi:hypothetical protein